MPPIVSTGDILMDQALAAFNAQMTAAVAHIRKKDIPLFYAKTALEALSRVVAKTPVDRGAARANWQVGIASSSDEPVDEIDKVGDRTVAKGQKKILAGATTLQDVHIFNNLPYIERLESGWSAQAPQGMVRLTILELQQFFS